METIEASSAMTPREPRKNSKLVARLRAKFRGAAKRVTTLKRQISELSHVILQGCKVVEVDGTKKRVKLSTPELRELRDRRNLLQVKLLQTSQELQMHESNYMDAVTCNSNASRKRLGTYRMEIVESHTRKVTAEIQAELNAALLKGFLEVVVNLKQLAVSEGVTPTFKQELVDFMKKSGRTDFRYIPSPSGIQIVEYLKHLDISVDDKPDLE